MTGPLLVPATVWLLLRRLHAQSDASPFVLTLRLVFLGHSGLGIGRRQG